MVALVDTWLTGNYLSTDAHMAAIGLIAYIMWLLPSLFASIAIGATAMTARFVGAGDVALAARVTNQAMLVGVALSAVSVVAVHALAPWFVGVMQLHHDAAPPALRYLQFLVPVIPAIMVEQVGIACLRGAGDMVSGFVAMSIVNVVNMALSSGLAIGWGPGLGRAGLRYGRRSQHRSPGRVDALAVGTSRYETAMGVAAPRPGPDPALASYRTSGRGGYGGHAHLSFRLCRDH